ncbi:hypothetical protein IQ07DRAFT_396799 [Pyrenochaeta sp. DS3sAY3a]|nr:hypothetical protein IQ07DRAFT_396799 [Pyrenochaeta sp. DS3sAY3a]
MRPFKARWHPTISLRRLEPLQVLQHENSVLLLSAALGLRSLRWPRSLSIRLASRSSILTQVWVVRRSGRRPRLALEESSFRELINDQTGQTSPSHLQGSWYVESLPAAWSTPDLRSLTFTCTIPYLRGLSRSSG